MNSKRPLHEARAGGHESGYSLIEVMVAMSIAVFLLAGLFTIFQGTRHTSTDQSGLAELQDEQRLAMTMITDIVQSAGFYSDVVNNTGPGVLTNDGGSFATDGQALYGTAPSGLPETMTVRFQTAPNDNVLNCNGGSNTGAVKVVYSNTFSIVTNAAGVSQLLCQVQTGIPAAGGAGALPLVNNVLDMHFWYAVNTTGATSGTSATATGTATGPVTNANCPADMYIATAQMGTTDWTNVCAVRVTLTFLNPLYQPPGQPKPTPGQTQKLTFSKVISVLGKAGPNVTSIVSTGGTGT